MQCPLDRLGSRTVVQIVEGGDLFGRALHVLGLDKILLNLVDASGQFGELGILFGGQRTLVAFDGKRSHIDQDRRKVSPQLFYSAHSSDPSSVTPALNNARFNSVM